MEPDPIPVLGRHDHRWLAHPGVELGLAGGVIFVSANGTKKTSDQS
jgi:hypothetical protein